MDFFLWHKNMIKMLLKIKVDTYLVNTDRNLLIILNNLLQMHLKLLQKEKIADKITKVSRSSLKNR